LLALIPLTDVSGSSTSRFAQFEPNPRQSTSRPAFEVRPGRVEDAEALAQLEHERHGSSVEELVKRFSVGLSVARSERLLLVATADGEVVGWGQVMHFQPSLEAPANHAPEGWYLGSLLVRGGWRRFGIGASLTRKRLAWVSTKASQAYYFANSSNRASIALHKGLGFEELTRDFWFPGVTFTGGEGVLFRVGVP